MSLRCAISSKWGVNHKTPYLDTHLTCPGRHIVGEPHGGHRLLRRRTHPRSFGRSELVLAMTPERVLGVPEIPDSDFEAIPVGRMTGASAEAEAEADTDAHAAMTGRAALLSLEQPGRAAAETESASR